MGTWGLKIYQDDIAEDVKFYYMDQLHRGKTGEIITQELIKQYRAEIADSDDAPVFWFALADTQWNVGRLQDDVKEKALWYIEDGSNLRRWEEENPALAKKRKVVLSNLKQKLLSPQPPEKKISQYRIYQCKWKLGDIYAYRFSGKYAEQNHLIGKYLFFVKVGEENWSIGHIIPMVYVYWVMSDKLMTVEELKDIGFIPQFLVPKVYENNPNIPIDYSLVLLNTSARVVPKNNLTYIGNIGITEPLVISDLTSYHTAWKDFEEYIIKNFQNWDGYQPR